MAKSLEEGGEGKGEGLGKAEMVKKACWDAEDLEKERWRRSGVRGWEGDDL